MSKVEKIKQFKEEKKGGKKGTKSATKKVDVKPVAKVETKTKPVETKPVETKPKMKKGFYKEFYQTMLTEKKVVTLDEIFDALQKVHYTDAKPARKNAIRRDMNKTYKIVETDKWELVEQQPVTVS